MRTLPHFIIKLGIGIYNSFYCPTIYVRISLWLSILALVILFIVSKDNGKIRCRFGRLKNDVYGGCLECSFVIREGSYGIIIGCCKSISIIRKLLLICRK